MPDSIPRGSFRLPRDAKSGNQGGPMQFVVEPTVYVDGSGAPCVIEHRGLRFACDYLGGVTLALRGCSQSFSGKRRSSAAVEVRRWYAAWVARETSPTWINQNFMMYAD